jgi:hypothetical protein
VAGELVGALFTSDPAVLDTATILAVIDPAKMRVAWLRLLADGMDDAVSLMSKRFRFERDSILPGLDYATLAAGYLVTAAVDMLRTCSRQRCRLARWVYNGTWRGHVVDPLHHHPIVCYAGARPRARSLQPGAAG